MRAGQRFFLGRDGSKRKCHVGQMINAEYYPEAKNALLGIRQD